MSSDTDDIIDLQITVADKVPEKPSFGTPMLVDYHVAWLDRYTAQYGRPGDMLDDGFTTEDALYQMATALKSQSPAPSVFKVGRLETPYTQIVTLKPTNTSVGFKYTGVVDGTTIEYVVEPGDTDVEIMAGLLPLINAVTTVTATSAAGKITVTTNLPGRFVQHSWGRGMVVQDATVDGGFDDDIAKIADEDMKWYGLLTVPQSKAYIDAAATWTEANGKVYFPQSSDADVLDGTSTTDIASVLKSKAFTRTAGIWHRLLGGTEWAGAAFLASILGKDPGAVNPAFRQLAGITADDLRSGDLTQLGLKNFTRYIRQGGANVTFEGKTGSGRYIDITRNVDWLEAEVRANIWGVFINNDIVPYSDDGISLIKGAVETALNSGQKMRVIATAPAPLVTVPKLADTTQADRAARLLRNVEFSARLNGAINRTIVRGVVSV